MNKDSIACSTYVWGCYNYICSLGLLQPPSRYSWQFHAFCLNKYGVQGHSFSLGTEGETIIAMTNNSMKERKEYKRPSLKVAELDIPDIIATSGTGGSVPDAPFGSARSRDYWDDEE